ncbi:MAG: polysaccharide deacetylase family protein [Ferruginibacter sp.]
MDPDPDPEAEQAASKILRTTFFTIVCTACNSFHTETSPAVATIQFSLPDSTPAKTVAAVPAKKKKKKTIYLTFDDGPNKGTRKVMHIAEEEQISISMFLVGEHVYGCAEQNATFDSLVNCENIELDNHSYSHANNHYQDFYSRPAGTVNDFVRCKDSLGLGNNIIRTPGRNIWRTKNLSSTDVVKSSAAADSLQAAGFTLIGWDLEWHFNSSLDLCSTDDEMLRLVDSMFARDKTKTTGHLVLLAHDQVYADANDSITLHGFIRKLKTADEYNIEVISKYPGIKN